MECGPPARRRAVPRVGDTSGTPRWSHPDRRNQGVSRFRARPALSPLGPTDEKDGSSPLNPLPAASVSMWSTSGAAGRRVGPEAGRRAPRCQRSTQQREVSLPDRRYELAGRLLAQSVEESAATGAPVLYRKAEEFGAQ